jgi:hypothetical protein
VIQHVRTSSALALRTIEVSLACGLQLALDVGIEAMQETYNRCTIGSNCEEGGDCNEETEAHGFQISERSEGGMPYARWSLNVI